MTALNVLLISAGSRADIKPERLLTVLDPADAVEALAELRVAGTLSEEPVLLTESVLGAGVPLGGGGLGGGGHVTLLQLPLFHTGGLLPVEHLGPTTLVLDAVGEEALTPLVTAVETLTVARVSWRQEEAVLVTGLRVATPVNIHGAVDLAQTGGDTDHRQDQQDEREDHGDQTELF